MAKPLIAVDAIFNKALELLDEHGVESLSTRNLAAALKCSTRTLYQQVGKKDELVGQLFTHYFAGLQLEFHHDNGGRTLPIAGRAYCAPPYLPIPIFRG